MCMRNVGLLFLLLLTSSNYTIAQVSDFQTYQDSIRRAFQEFRSSNNKEANVRSKLKTSIAKIIAAIGDLKIEAMAPAAAQAINKLLVFLSICNNRLKLELKAEADAIAGPKRPTDPPKPTVSGAVIKGK